MVLLQKRPTIANELTLTRFHNNHASQASAGWIDVIAVPRSTDEGAQNKRNDDGGAQNKRNDRWFVYKNERGAQNRVTWWSAQTSKMGCTD